MLLNSSLARLPLPGALGVKCKTNLEVSSLFKMLLNVFYFWRPSYSDEEGEFPYGAASGEFAFETAPNYNICNA